MRATDVEDLSTARALIATLQDQLTKIPRGNAALRHRLDVLCQRLFGKKAERVDARQLQLALEQLAKEPGAVTEPIEIGCPESASARSRSISIGEATPTTNADNAACNVELRDVMIDLGWQSSCAFGPDALCERWEPGAPHTESAWRARVWRARGFLFPA